MAHDEQHLAECHPSPFLVSVPGVGKTLHSANAGQMYDFANLSSHVTCSRVILQYPTLLK